MKRIYELRPNGTLALAEHLLQGYQALMMLDRKHRRTFTVVGVRTFLTDKFGPKKGQAIARGLFKAGVIQPLGFIHGRSLPAGVKEFKVTRFRTAALAVAYVEYQNGTKRRPKLKRCISVQASSGRRAIGAILAVPNGHPDRATHPRRRTIPTALVKQLLRAAKLPGHLKPHLVELKFHFR